jgi:hypothetical protein
MGKKPDDAAVAIVSVQLDGNRHNQSVLVLSTGTVIESVDGPGEVQRRRRYDFKTRRVAAVNDDVILVMANENWIDQIHFGNGNKTHSAFNFKFPCIRHSPYIQTRFENILNTMKN